MNHRADPVEQGDLFPLLSPQTVLSHIQRAQARLRRLAPLLTAAELAEVLGEIALLERRTDVLEGRRWHRARFPHAPSAPATSAPLWPLAAAHHMTRPPRRRRAAPPSRA